jgi:uncharacterized protein YbaP (TraB family)
MRFGQGKLARWAALAAAFALAASPAAGAPVATAAAGKPAPAATAHPKPALWLLADEDTRIYLFGTIHILPAGLQWRSPTFDAVARAADELVLEVAEDPDEAAAPSTRALMMLEAPRPILERVSPERRAALQEMIESLGLQPVLFDRMQTWAAVMTIAVVGMTQAMAGPDGSLDDLPGVEDALRVDFTESRRPISGVETGPQQLGFLAGLSAATQQAMLDELVDSYLEGDPDLMEPSDEDWLRGDLADIAEEMAELPPELYEVLVTRRNRAWTRWLIDRLDRPGTVLFAVGAGHLAGRDSVQSMLQARGFTVRRVH